MIKMDDKRIRAWWCTVYDESVIESSFPCQIKQIFVRFEINNKRVRHRNCNILRSVWCHPNTTHNRAQHFFKSSSSRTEIANDVILMNFRSLKYSRHYFRFFPNDILSKIGCDAFCAQLHTYPPSYLCHPMVTNTLWYFKDTPFHSRITCVATVWLLYARTVAWKIVGICNSKTPTR